METISAVYNHGRWIVLCPVHGTHGAMPAENTYICPVCYPKIVASFWSIKDGRIQPVPDSSARRTARLEAKKDDQIYAVKYPKDREMIEKELSELPKDKRHWTDGDLESLKADVQRTKHIIENYNKRNKSIDGNNPVMVVTRGE